MIPYSDPMRYAIVRVAYRYRYTPVYIQASLEADSTLKVDGPAPIRGCCSEILHGVSQAHGTRVTPRHSAFV